MRQVLSPVAEQAEAITPTDGEGPRAGPWDREPSARQLPTRRRVPYENFYGGTGEKTVRWLWLQRAPAEHRKAFKVQLSTS